MANNNKIINLYINETIHSYTELMKLNGFRLIILFLKYYIKLINFYHI